VKRYTRVVRVPPGVRERSEWPAFGAAAGSGGNDGCTMRSYDEIHFEKAGEAAKSELDKFIDGAQQTVRTRAPRHRTAIAARQPAGSLPPPASLARSRSSCAGTAAAWATTTRSSARTATSWRRCAATAA